MKKHKTPDRPRSEWDREIKKLESEVKAVQIPEGWHCVNGLTFDVAHAIPFLLASLKRNRYNPKYWYLIARIKEILNHFKT
jgi:hypothetical protein